MNEYFALQTRAMRLLLDAAEAQRHAVTTIALRLPMLAASGFGPKGPSREAKRMVAEKIEAVMEGAMNGAMAGSELATRGMWGQLNPMRLASGMVGIAEATQNPSHRRVKANAKRLSARL